MVYLIAFLIIAVYGAWYAKDPMRSLKRKYRGEEVPKASVTAARVVGVILVVIGAIGAISSLVSLLNAG